jgi:hypothetical protein
MGFCDALVATLLSTLILGGCASSSVRQIAREPTAGPLRVVLVETPNSVDPPTLRRVFAPDLPEDSEEARKLVQSGVAKAEAQAMAEMQNALTNLAGMVVLSSEAITRSVNDLQINNPETKLRQETANELRIVSGAEGLLRFRITDYGQTPKTWQKWVIGWEIVSTLGVAAIAYAAPKTRPLAGVYLVEESIEETIEAYSGFWALNKLCRPVRIEAELIELRTGETMWADSNTGLAEVRLIRLVTTVDAATRDAQLEAATHESAEGLIDRLVKSLMPAVKSSGSGG